MPLNPPHWTFEGRWGVPVWWTYHREVVAEQHQQLGQHFLLHLPLKLDQPTEAGEQQTVNMDAVFSLSQSVFITCTFGDEMETYTAVQARSLEIHLVFLNSLQRFKSSTQNGWLGKNKERRTSALTGVMHSVIFFKQSHHSTHFSCVAKISKQPLASIWFSILRKGIDTLGEKGGKEQMINSWQTSLRTGF